MLALVRLFEPHVFKVVKAEVKYFWNKLCCKKKINKKTHVSESLCQYMNSAMNRELVYLILMGINNHMEDINELDSPFHEQIIDLRGNKREKKKITLMKDHSKTKIIFDQIKFKNVKDLNVLTESGDTVSTILQKQNFESIRQQEYSKTAEKFKDVPILPEVADEEDEVDRNEFDFDDTVKARQRTCRDNSPFK